MQNTIELDVRYYETDGQGVVHHANYFKYFELARVEMLKAMGHDYADLERDGVFLVVHSVGCKFMRPARFGDTLRIVTEVVRATPARIEHRYHVFIENLQVAEGQSVIACVDGDGNIQRMPDILLNED